MTKFFVVASVVNLIITAVVVLVVGSAITSGIKAANHDCDSHYQIEAVFSGNWFCPDTQKE